MIDRLRLRLLLFALMLAVSHVALISHDTAHFEPALEHCKLCVSQPQPLAAIPADTHWAVPPSLATVLWPVREVCPPASASPAPFLQRAPPPSSA